MSLIPPASLRTLRSPGNLPSRVTRRSPIGSRPAVALVALLAASSLLLPPVASDGAPTVIPWDLRTCEFVFGSTTAQIERIEPFLSPGFTAVPFGQGVTLVNFEAEVCESGAGLEGQVPGMVYSGFSVAVQPPAELVLPGMTSGHYQSWLHVVPDADRRAELQAVGMQAYEGSVDITTVTTPGDQAMVRQAMVDLDGFGQVVMEVVAERVPTPTGGRFVEYNPAPPGSRVVAWETDWLPQEHYSGFGVVTFPPDSWLAEVFPVPVIRMSFMAGTWSYLDGTITYPIDYDQG